MHYPASCRCGPLESHPTGRLSKWYETHTWVTPIQRTTREAVRPCGEEERSRVYFQAPPACLVHEQKSLLQLLGQSLGTEPQTWAAGCSCEYTEVLRPVGSGPQHLLLQHQWKGRACVELSGKKKAFVEIQRPFLIRNSWKTRNRKVLPLQLGMRDQTMKPIVPCKSVI